MTGNGQDMPGRPRRYFCERCGISEVIRGPRLTRDQVAGAEGGIRTPTGLLQLAPESIPTGSLSSSVVAFLRQPLSLADDRCVS